MALVQASPAESSFLTSLNAERQKALGKQQRRQELLENMKSGDDILEKHKALQQLANELDNKVEDKLHMNEKAFFVAYESHWYMVQKEFNELRQKADEEETKTRRDAKIQSLEKELDWFMTEALRLDELCKKYKKELDTWKGKAEGLEDDRQFLENQIKTAKRNNKALRGAVEKAQTSAYSALVSADEGSELGVPPQQDAQSPEQHNAPRSLALEDAGGTSGGLSKELEAKYQAAKRRLKQQLATEQKLAAKLRASTEKQFAEPSELESFFVECVDKVKSNIADRKRATGANLQKLKSVRPRAGKESLPPASGYPGPTTVDRVSLDDFTAADRRQVVELLLSSDAVIQFLHDKLVPPVPGSMSEAHQRVGN